MTTLSGAPPATGSTPPSFASILGAEAQLSFRGRPGGVAIASDGTMWVSDPLGGTIWQVQDGQMIPVVRPSRSGDPASTKSMRLLSPSGIVFGPDGTLYVADPSGQRVCAVSPDGLIRLVAGGTNGYSDGLGADAQFRYPSDVAADTEGTLYVTDTGNDRIRRITLDRNVTTMAGSIYDFGDGRGPHGRFRRPGALDVGVDGTCYVADTGNNAVRVIAPDGDVATLAGSPPGGDQDGTGADVGLRWPTGIVVGPRGDVWVADHGNGAVRHIDVGTGASETVLRLDGQRWPVSLAGRGDGSIAVAVAELPDVHAPRGALLVIGGRS